MTGRLFDVYLTGAKDKSPSTQMRLTTSIAERYRLAAPAVAAALEGVPCRVAEGLGAPEAEALVSALAMMGATARLSPRGTPLGGRDASEVLTRGTSATWSDVLAPTTGRKDGRITLKSADLQVPSVVDVSEPIEFAEPGPDAKTGVRGADTIRCPVHGLVYNRRKASGCVKCLASARAQARKLHDESVRSLSPLIKGGSSFREDTLRRAFGGLTVALLVGFLPAAYYARWPNRDALLALRDRQAQISSLPATKESLARFDELDAAVDTAHRRGAGRTLVIWMLGTGIAGAVWIRVTRPRYPDDPEA